MEQGPKQPLDEAHAEIEQLQSRIEQYEAVCAAARVYLLNSTPVNALALYDALKLTEGEQE